MYHAKDIEDTLTYELDLDVPALVDQRVAVGPVVDQVDGGQQGRVKQVAGLNINVHFQLG